MKNKRTNLWLGLAVGTLAGVLAARKLVREPRMPNARNWQRILSESRGQVPAAVLMARIQQAYEKLLERRPVFENPVFNIHVKDYILPGLALYQVLREDGMAVQEALVEIDGIFEFWFDQYLPLNLRMNRLMAYTPQNFEVFQSLVYWVMDKFFPAPGWEYELLDVGENTLAFNIHTCFYIQILEYYQAPELTPVFCKLDDLLMAAMPSTIRWGRTQTIGMGAPFCDFRWQVEPPEQGLQV